MKIRKLGRSRKVNSFQYIIITIVLLTTLGITTQSEIVNAESSAIIVTVDGLSFGNFIPCLYFEQSHYLKEAIESLDLPIDSQDIISFPWSTDAGDTNQAVSDLKDLLQECSENANAANKQLIIVAHSWGTFLTYAALSHEPEGDEPITPDLLIMLSTPLGTDNTHSSKLLMPLFPLDIAVSDYVGYRLWSLDFSSWSAPNGFRTVNFWAWGDCISGPLGNWMPSAENVQLYSLFDMVLYGADYFTYVYRNDLSIIMKWHGYTSLDPEKSFDNELRNRIKNLIEETITDVPEDIPILYNPNVSPMSGDTSDTYTFSVNYKNANGDAPSGNITLNFGDEDWGMMPEDNPPYDYQNGVKYSIAVANIAEGEYEANFSTPWANPLTIPFSVYEEQLANVPPSFLFTDPLSEEQSDWGGYTIRWLDSDPDNPDASIMLFYDTDTDFFNAGRGVIWHPNGDPAIIQIADSQNSFYWDTSDIPPGTYYIVAAVEDYINNPVIVYSPGTIEVSPPASGNHFELSNMSDWTWDDDSSENDQDYVNGIPEGLESLEVTIPITNISGSNMQFVHGTLSSTAYPINFTDGDNYVNYGNINAGQTIIPDDDFGFRITSPSYTNTPFNLLLQYEDTSGNNYQQNLPFYFTFPLQGSQAPVLVAGTAIIDDSGDNGDGDGILESGERIDFFVPLNNIGNAPCVNPKGVITQSTVWGNDVFSDLDNVYPDIPAGDTRNNEYDYDTYWVPKNFSGDIPCTMTVWYGPDRDKSQEVNFTLSVSPAPYMNVAPDSYDFGVASPGTILEIPFVIYSNGSAPLGISNVSSDNADTTVSGYVSTPFMIPADESPTFTVSIDTTGLNGNIERIVTVTSNNAYTENTQTFTITGMIGSGGGEFAIVELDGDQVEPHINGDKLVFRSNHTGQYHIYCKDLISGEVIQLTTDDDYFNYSPRIYGDKVVWVRRPSNGTTTDNEVYLLDLNDFENHIRLTNDSLHDGRVRIWGDYIIWEKWITTDPIRGDIYLYRISNGSTTRLTNTPTISESDPEMQGNYAIWKDNYSRIFRCTLSSGSISQLADLNYINDLDIYDDNIIWIDEIYTEDYYYDVFLYNNGLPINISWNFVTQDEEELTIWDNIVIYCDYPNYRLFKIEIGGSGEEVFVSETSVKSNVFMCEDKVVWESNKNGNWDIFMKSLIAENLAINHNNINHSPVNPSDADDVTISAIIQNQGESTLNDITIRFYEGDPAVDGIQIGADQVISSIAAGNTSIASIIWQPDNDDMIPIYVAVDPDNSIPENNETDNIAYININIHDNDTDGPDITDISIEEYGGDGDGQIEDNEQAQFLCIAEDASGCGDASLSIDGQPVTLNKNGCQYDAIIGPLTIGMHAYSLEICDVDNSPACTTTSGIFSVMSSSLQIVSTNPDSGATGISLRPVISIVFDDSLDPATVNSSSIILTDSSSQPISGDISYNPIGNVVTFIPLLDLTNSETYTVTITSEIDGIKSEGGNILPSSYSWSFTTIEDSILPVAIITNPETDQNLCGLVDIYGTAWDQNFESYQVFYGIGVSPSSWNPVSAEINDPVLGGILCQWDTSSLIEGVYSLKLLVKDKTPASNQNSIIVSVTIVSHKGDFDGNGCIELYDFVEFASAFGSQEGDSNYNAAGDFDDNGKIELYDFVEFVIVFGTCY